MRFVIMADGKGTRWNNYMGVPKHLVEINGEPIIARTVRLLNEISTEENKEQEVEVIITSHDQRYEFEGSRRHEPENNHYEIDRFTEELVQDDMCFLYGDTYYEDDVLKKIVTAKTDSILFFGNEKSIVAVKIKDADEFRTHFNKVKDSFIKGEISKCKGWQLYQSFTGQNLNEKPVIGQSFITVGNDTTDINTPDEYERTPGKNL